MWLPTPLYEKAPHYWLLLGLLLIALGVYLGLEVGGAYLIVGVGCGIVSCIWSARTYWRRSLHRESKIEVPENI